MSKALAQLNLAPPGGGFSGIDLPGDGGLPLPGRPRRDLTNRQKAAVIVRLLLAEGTPVPLAALPDHLQTALTEQIALMRSVDRDTLAATVAEFLAELEGIGLSFPGGLDGALTMLDGHISASAANRLRRLAGANPQGDPWEKLTALPNERLLPVLEEESVEVGAVALSMLPVAKAAELLGLIPGERARRIARAMQLTADIDPDTVQRIGLSLAGQLDSQPPKAFEAGPVERVGAILNISASALRDDVLQGLDEADKGFADEVRRAIFTFAHIPKRIEARDVPRILRVVDQSRLVTALAAATGDLGESAEFILTNISQRMATGLREEMAARGKVKEKDGEAAMNEVIAAIRALEAQGEISLVQDEEED